MLVLIRLSLFSVVAGTKGRHPRSVKLNLIYSRRPRRNWSPHEKAENREVYCFLLEAFEVESLHDDCQRYFLHRKINRDLGKLSLKLWCADFFSVTDRKFFEWPKKIKSVR